VCCLLGDVTPVSLMMLQSSPVKPSGTTAHPATGSVVTDPTLRLMAAAAAAAGTRPARMSVGGHAPPPPSPLPLPSDLTPRPSVAAAAVAANELYASLVYSHQHQLDRAAMLMQQHAHASPFSAAASSASMSQRGGHLQPPPSQSVPGNGAAAPPQAHTGTAFALSQYQSPAHPHPHHHLHAAAVPAAAAAFESYSQSLATLSQLSQRLQLHAAAGPHGRLPAVPPSPLGVDPYLAAAAVAAHGGRAAGSPVCERQISGGNLVANSPRRSPSNNESATPLIKTQYTRHSPTPYKKPYDFCEADLSPGDKLHLRYKDDDTKEPRHRHHHHHHHQHHYSQYVQQQQQRKSDAGDVGDVYRDENHNAFNDDKSDLEMHRREKRPEVTIAHVQTGLPLAAAHICLHDHRHQFASSHTAGKGVTGNGNDGIRETSLGPEILFSGRRSTAMGHNQHQLQRDACRAQQADFTRGSMIQLSDGCMKRIEDMRTDDFVINCSSNSSVKLAGGVVTSSQLVLVSSRVVHIRLNHDTCTALLGFVVDNNIYSPVFCSFSMPSAKTQYTCSLIVLKVPLNLVTPERI